MTKRDAASPGGGVPPVLFGDERARATASSGVAIIGAGVSGLACARTLAGAGVQVTLFDEGHAVGGRLATRREEAQTFDLGAQYFTARDDRFLRVARAWRDAGVASPWEGRIVALEREGGALRATDPLTRLVGTPDMSALARDLAIGLEVKRAHRVERISRIGDELVLSGTSAEGALLGPRAGGDPPPRELGRYAQVLVCVPADQAAPLLAPVCPSLAAEAASVSLAPCVALGVADDDDDALAALPFDGAFVGRDDASSRSLLAWVARDSSKPGRPRGERWVLHATEAWSRAARDEAPEAITEAMLAELSRLFALGPLRPERTVLRRWVYARAPRPLTRGALFDVDASVGVGGDWLAGGRVEGAFLSGVALAERVLAALEATPARAAW